MPVTYDRETVLDTLTEIADRRLSGPTTLELTAWETGGFQVRAFHTIDSTYPVEEESRGESDGLPFYREVIVFSTSGESEGWFRQEVRKCYCGRTYQEVVHTERIGGYSENAPVNPSYPEENGLTPLVPRH